MASHPDTAPAALAQVVLERARVILAASRQRLDSSDSALESSGRLLARSFECLIGKPAGAPARQVPSSRREEP